ncbi:Rha family transcriptional regulator [Paraburkholderia bryophila]|uniref:Rha family transcriptional regulator n=1 Tax=Paraburkholderia bryophila TaxID=420952 RepID=UPI0038BC9A0E
MSDIVSPGCDLMEPMKMDALCRVREDNEIVTDALTVSREFGRRHDNVLAALDSLIEDGTLNHLDFKAVEYRDGKGEFRRTVELTERGALIAMPFIGGRKSRQGQSRLIDSFLAMREELRRLREQKTEAEPTRALDADEKRMRRDFLMLGLAADNLNLCQSTRLRMNSACADLHGCSTSLLPAHAIDAPKDGPQISSLPTDSLRSLLSKVRAHYRASESKKKVMTAREFYELMQFAGMVEYLSRASTSTDADENGLKWFWSISAEGLNYAKNMTDPKSPRQTQPHFYRGHFDELRRKLSALMPEYLKWKAEQALKTCAEYAASASRCPDVREAAEYREDLR